MSIIYNLSAKYNPLETSLIITKELELFLYFDKYNDQFTLHPYKKW